MNTIDFSQTGGMPVDQSTLNFMQQEYNSLLKQLGGVLGQYIIINGSQDTGGWVAIDGEIMPFDQGSGDDCYIRESKESVIFQDGESKPVYTTKKLVFGVGTPLFKWSDFQKINTLIDLQTRMPIGTVQMFAGNTVPQGWDSCEGQSLLKSEYPKLWEVLQREDPKDKSRFLLPDLKSRFIVGQDSTKDDYKKIGNTGGQEIVTLSVEQMPEHKHGGKTSINGKHKHNVTIPAWATNGVGWGSGSHVEYIHQPTDEQGDHTHDLLIDNTGGGKSHENRPPYYVMKYIIFLG